MTSHTPRKIGGGSRLKRAWARRRTLAARDSCVVPSGWEEQARRN